MKLVDGVIICISEYVRGVLGFLKNVFDWIVFLGEFVNKLVVVISVFLCSLGGDKVYEFILFILEMIEVKILKESILWIGVVGIKINNKIEILDFIMSE